MIQNKGKRWEMRAEKKASVWEAILGIKNGKKWEWNDVIGGACSFEELIENTE